MAPQPLKRLRTLCAVVAIAAGGFLAVLAWSTHDELAEQERLRHQVVAERVLDEMERELSLLLLQEQQRPAYVSVSQTHPDTWAPFVVGYYVQSEGQTRLLADAELSAERRRRLRWAAETSTSGKHAERSAASWDDVLSEEKKERTPRSVVSEAQEKATESNFAESGSAFEALTGESRQAPPAPMAPQVHEAEAVDVSQRSSRRKGAEAAPSPTAWRSPKKKRKVARAKKSKASSPQVLRRLNRGQEQRPQTKPRPAGKEKSSRDPMHDYDLGM